MWAVAWPEVATRMANVTCASLFAGMVTSVNRDVTISMESVRDETFTRTGYGWLFLTVTGILAVSLTTVMESVGVMDTPPNMPPPSRLAPSTRLSMLRGADESACSASVLCAALILRIQDADALWSVRTDVAKRLMSLRLSASDSSADVTDRVFRSLK